MTLKFDKLLKTVPEEIKLLVSRSFDISSRILDILDEKGMTQKNLADILSESEEEIAQWMKGTYDFTPEIIDRIECALGAKLILSQK